MTLSQAQAVGLGHLRATSRCSLEPRVAVQVERGGQEQEADALRSFARGESVGAGAAETAKRVGKVLGTFLLGVAGFGVLVMVSERG